MWVLKWFVLGTCFHCKVSSEFLHPCHLALTCVTASMGRCDCRALAVDAGGGVVLQMYTVEMIRFKTAFVSPKTVIMLYSILVQIIVKKAPHIPKRVCKILWKDY